MSNVNYDINYGTNRPTHRRIVQEKVSGSRPRLPHTPNSGGSMMPKEKSQNAAIMMYRLRRLYTRSYSPWCAIRMYLYKETDHDVQVAAPVHALVQPVVRYQDVPVRIGITNLNKQN